MKKQTLALALFATTALGFLTAQAQKGAPPAPAPAAGGGCKMFGKACCDPAVTAHLDKDAIFRACGESDATFLGEAGSGKDTCKFHFKVEGKAEKDTYVQIYTQNVPKVPDQPTDPLWSYKKVGKAWVTEAPKASPKGKSLPTGAGNVGIYYPGKGFFVTVGTTVDVCTRPEVAKLAAMVK